MRDIKIRQWKAGFKQRLKDGLKGIAAAIYGATRWLWQTAGIKAQDIHITALISKRHDELYRLGEKCYELYRHGHLMHNDLLSVCKHIEMLDERISKWEMQRRRVTSRGGDHQSHSDETNGD